MSNDPASTVTDFTSAPNWVKAADNHNVASSGLSVLDSLGDFNPVSHLTVSAISGINSLYNSATHLVNYLGADIEKTDTGELIASFDDDLGQYYKKYKSSSDLLGFIATSFIPGLGATKAFRGMQASVKAAQTGAIGANTSRATGLLIPKADTFIKQHAADLAARSGTWKLFSFNTTKSIAEGMKQGALEGLVWEAAVFATMHQSPIFEDMSAMDMIKNAGIGIVFGGGFGGIAGVAQNYFRVKDLLVNADSRQLQLATGFTPTTKNPLHPADTILAAHADLKRLSNPITEEQVKLMKVASGETGESVSASTIRAETGHLNILRERSIAKAENDIVSSIRKLSESKVALKGEKDTLGVDVAEILKKVKNDDAYALFDRMQRFVRLGETSNFEKQVAMLAKNLGVKPKELTSSLSKKEIEELIGPDSTAYLQLHSGEILTSVLEDPSKFGRLADFLSPEGIKAFVKKNKISFKKPVKLSDGKMDIKQLEARWIWARRNVASIPKGAIIDESDIPLLFAVKERAAYENVSIITDTGDVLKFNSSEAFENFYRESQIKLINKLIGNRGRGKPADYLELATDIKKDVILQANKERVADDYTFRAQEFYADELSKIVGRTISASSLHDIPKYLKVNYHGLLKDNDGNIIRGLQGVKYQETLYQEAADRAAAKVIGPDAELFIPYSDEVLASQNRTGVGQGNITNAGGNFGSFESFTSYNGNIVRNLEERAAKSVTEAATPITQTILHNPDAAIAFSALNERMAGLPDIYYLADNNAELIHSQLFKAMKEAEGDEELARVILNLPDDIPDKIEIPLNIRNAVRAHVEISDRQTLNSKILAAVEGNNNTKELGAFRPYRKDPRQFKHHAFVVDDTIAGAGHVKMILARDGDHLEEMISKIKAGGSNSPYKVLKNPGNLHIRTSPELDEYFKARDRYQYENTLHDNYLDSELASKGVRSDFVPMTDPQLIADTALQHYIRQETKVLRDAISLKFHKMITQSERLGDIYAASHGSSTDHYSRLAVSTKNNPYIAQIKSLFNMSRLEDAPGFWMSGQRALDKGVSIAYNRAQELWQGLHGADKLSDDAKLEKIDRIFTELGHHSSYKEASTQILALANKKIDQGVLTSFVRTANTFLLNTVLRLDMFNPINNFLGNSVIMIPEVRKLIKGIENADPKLAGKLAELGKVTVPGSGGRQILSPAKLIANAHKQAFEVLRNSDTNPTPLFRELRDRGLVPDMTVQLYRGIDALTMTGTTTAKDLTAKTAILKDKLNNIINKGAKLTGNEYVEKLNRTHAALTMKTITDLAVEAGIITEKESWAYINMFVNRLNGTIRAAERPLMFQGPIGQAMGLFQTYQLNLIQQAFRHIGEGQGKTLAIMAGIQTSIYGASSLPALNYINSSLIGNAYGNTEHADIYSGVRTAFGKEAGDWIMYGAPSNILNAALYTRGNTNPRTWHVVPNPTNPSELPFVNTFSRTVESLSRAAQATADGAPVFESFLSALEHSGISRPLAGLAVSARGLTNEGTAFSTQKDGAFLFSNDMLSIATLMRIAGAKPIDEAIIQNDYYRVAAYRAEDIARKKELGIALKAVIRDADGGVPDIDAINNFAQKYMELGGNQKGFNSYYMNQYKKATTSQAELLSRNLNTPYGRQMQFLMGGRDILDEEL